MAGRPSGCTTSSASAPSPRRDFRQRAGQQRAHRHPIEAGHRMGRPDVQPPTIDRGPCPRPRLQRADLPVEVLRGLAPVQPAIGPMEWPDQGRLLRILGLGLERAVRPALQLRGHDLSGQLGEARFELGRGLAAGQRHRPLGHDRPGIELRRHDHQADPTGLIAGQDGGGHRRRAAVARQQRRMDVERWPFPYRQQVIRHELAVGDQQEPVRAESFQRAPCLVGAEPAWRLDLQAVLACPAGDRRGP